MGKGFAKSPRIVKFSSRKYKWVRSGTRFSAELIFWSKLHDGFLCFSLACLTESHSFGYGLEDLISLHKFVVKVV